uniref:Sodium/glucose cotransporter 4-like n=1 Tax=Nannospalax galili TaxID=1026970 RepID=A0A8C6QCT7_NANGA
MSKELATMGRGASKGGVRADPALHVYDIVVVGIYFVFIIAVGIWVRTIGGYFLAGKLMSWWPIGASPMSSNVGSGLFIGLAVRGFEWIVTFLLLALGWIFVPVYIAAGVVTMPQYLKKRFGGQRIQVYMSVLSLILYIFTKISTDIFSGALFIQLALGWNLYLSTVILLVLTAVYTIAGGLTAVIYTDALQTVITVGGALVLMFLGFQEVGWYPGLQQLYKQDIPNATVPNTTSHLPRPDSFHMFRDPVNGDIPWPGLIFGLTVLATWCCLGHIRKNFQKGRSRAKSQGMLGQRLKAWETSFQRDSLRGLMIAVIMAALMSSLTSIFNSSSTLFAIDVWQQQELMVVGRMFVVFLVVISILWIPIIQSSNSGQLFDYIQSVTSYLAPPITALFLLAIFCKRITEPGAFWGLMFGLGVACGEMDRRPAVLKDFHYLYFALLLCGLTAVVIVTVSLCTVSIPEEKLARLTWWTRNCPLSELEKETCVSVKEEKDSTPELADSPAGGCPEEGGATANFSQEPEQLGGSHGSWGKWLWAWFCGISEAQQQALSSGEKAVLEQKLTSIAEEPLWRNICNINAIFLLAINIFFWGYFA